MGKGLTRVDRIVTLCMNPALDITTGTEVVRPTDKLRCSTPRYDPGGGGINVALVAQNLGAAAMAVFPAGAPAGELICNLLAAEGLASHRIPIGGCTRESLTANEASTNRQFRFVPPGPQLTVAEQTECLGCSCAMPRPARRSWWPAAACRSGVPPDFYQQVANVCTELGVTFLLDTREAGSHTSTPGCSCSSRACASYVSAWAGRWRPRTNNRPPPVNSSSRRGAARHLLVSLRRRRHAGQPGPRATIRRGAGDHPTRRQRGRRG